MAGYRDLAIDVFQAFFSGSITRLAPERDRIFREGKIPEQNHGVFNDVLFGIVRRYRSFDALIDTFADPPLDKLDPLVHAALRLGTYEILFLDGVPGPVAVNEAVNVVKKNGTSSSANFVNAVLRNVLRSLTDETWELPDDPTALGIENLFPVRDLTCREFTKPVMPAPHDGVSSVVQYVSAVFNYPEWLVGRWIDAYGIDRTWEIAQTQVRVPSLTLRRNPLVREADAFEASFEEQNIRVEETDRPGFYRVYDRRAPDELPGFEEGAFSVQDRNQGAALAELDLDGHPAVLDVCAAPGGKTTQAQEQAGGDALVVAADADRDRLDRLTENVKRLRLSGIAPICADGRTPPFKPESFDVIMLDVPCSNTGVLSSRVEARFHLSDNPADELVPLQQSLLENALDFLKPDGRLLYSTCSLLPEENEATVEAVLDTHPSFEQEQSTTVFPTEKHPTGAYAAVLSRT